MSRHRSASADDFIGSTCPDCRRVIRLEWWGLRDGWKFEPHGSCPGSGSPLPGYARRGLEVRDG